MTKDEVIARRNLIKSKRDIPIVIVTDNLFTYSERTDYIKWDDETGQVIAIKANQSLDISDTSIGGAQIRVDIFDYNEIQYLRAGFTKELFEDTFKGKGIFTDDQICGIIRKFCPSEKYYIKPDVDITNKPLK